MSRIDNADLCWGQRYIWLRYHQLPAHARHEAHIVLRLKLPDRVPLPRIRSALTYLIRRHEALRTTYHLDAGPQPQQRVHPPGTVPVREVSTERDGTPSPAEVVEPLITAPFDLATEWPIRACAVTTGGWPRRLVLVLNHLAFDSWSVDEFEREIKALGGSAGRPVALEPVRNQPLDLASHESSPEAAALRERTIGYWRDEIARLPSDTFGAVRQAGPADGAPAHSATLTSPALLDVCRRIAARYRVWPSQVHVTAYNLLMAAYTRSASVAVMAFTGLRDTGPFSNVMTCLFAPTLLRVDSGDDPTFGELLRRSAQRFDLAREHSYLPYDELLELIARESAGRGTPMRLGSELNFVSQPHRRCGARHTKFTWNPTPSDWVHAGCDVSFRINEWNDAAVITFNAIASVMPPEILERFLRGYERVLLRLDESGEAGDNGEIDGTTRADLRVSDVAGLLGLLPAAAGRTVTAGTDLVDLDHVERLIDRHPAVQSTKLWTDAEGGLVAHITAERPVTPAQLRAHVLGGMYDEPLVRCPDWFVVHNAATPPVEGDGRTAEPSQAATNAERVLAAVGPEGNGLDQVDVSAGYG